MAAPILGDILFRAASLWTRLAGNTTTTVKFLRQTGTGAASAAPSWNQVADADLSLTDVTTNNSSTAAHGFLKKLDNSATTFMNGQGNWATPAGAGNVSTSATLTAGKTIIGSGTTTVDVSTLTAQFVGSSSGTAAAASMTTARMLGRTTASSGAVEEITVGAGLSLSAGSLTATGTGGGSEVDYVEFTSGVSPTATTEATANTVVTSSTIAYDGATIVLIEFSCINARPDAAAIARTLSFWLYEDSGSIGLLGFASTPAASSMNVPIRLCRRMTPSNASHAYSIRCSVNAGTALVQAGAGGAATNMPGFIRISRA